MNWIFSKLRHMDVWLAVICFLLLLTGLVVIYSTTLNGGGTVFVKQTIYAVAAVAIFFFFSYFDFNAISKAGRYLYVLFVILLFSVLFIGTNVNGSRRWFNLHFFTLQPAEFAKLVVIFVLARFFALRRGEINIWRNVLYSFLYVLIPIILIAGEPDLGSSIIIFVIWFGILLLSNVHKRIFIYIFIFLAIFSAFSWVYVLKDYQKSRIESFIDPSLDPKGRGYNVQQAIIAVGSGGFFGRGLGKGLQSQLKFLPERQTDFVFASAAEELGFVGSMVIVILYFILLYRMLMIYRRSRDDLGRFMVAGIFFMVFGQVVINIGMNMGVLPVTGIPLPLISAGGSSLLTLAVAFGIVESVAIKSKGLRLD